MLYAAIVQCPVFKGTLKSVDEAEARRHERRPPGGEAARTRSRSSPTAGGRRRRRLDALTDRPGTSPAMARRFERHASASILHAGLTRGRCRRRPHARQRRPTRLRQAVKRIEADYEVPFLGHATMEPQNCTAHVTRRPGRNLGAHAGRRSGAGHRRRTPPASRPTSVIVHKTMLGGGFGRRGIFQDFVRQAVLIAKEVGEPVKLVWSREEDTRHDYYRPVAMRADDRRPRRRRHAARLESAHVRPVDLAARLIPATCVSASTGNFQQGLLDDMPYDVPNYLVDYRDAQHACARSASGAASTTRRTASSRKASSTRWRMPPAADPLHVSARACSAASQRAKFLARARRRRRRAPAGAHRCRRACFAASRCTSRYNTFCRRRSPKSSVDADGEVRMHRIVIGDRSRHMWSIR